MDMTRPKPTTPRIVIVEDDASLLAALVFSFEAEGFQVHAFGRGGPLLSAPIRADCLVVDFRLPDEDGLSLISRLRARGYWFPAILTTSHPGPRIRRRAEAMGVQIVEKPLITGELRRRIDELVAQNRR